MTYKPMDPDAGTIDGPGLRCLTRAIGSGLPVHGSRSLYWRQKRNPPPRQEEDNQTDHRQVHARTLSPCGFDGESAVKELQR